MSGANLGLWLLLRSEERSGATQEKYLRDIRRFYEWLGGRAVTREIVAEWKEPLLSRRKSTATVNVALSALNSLFRFLDWSDCRTRFLKIQRSAFCDPSRELSRAEYSRLVSTAWQRGDEQLALILETICATGIRVSELRYITVEAARQGTAEIRLKGKFRVILLPGKLCKKLLKYAGKAKNTSGEIFLTRIGRLLNRRQIWAGEGPVRMGGCCAGEGFSAQSAASVCHRLLPRDAGYSEACGYSGPFQR